MDEKERLKGFQAVIRDQQASDHCFEESDGSLLEWRNLSPEAKLSYITLAAARYDIQFNDFAAAVQDMIGDPTDAAMRLVLKHQRELYGLAKLLPDDGRTEPTPLVESLREILNYKEDQAAETPAMERDRGIER